MSIDAGQIIRHTGMEISVTVQTATGPPVTAEGYQDSDRSSQKRLECRTGIAPDEVSDREAGTNRSGNTGRTRLLYREGVFFYTQGLREQRAAQQSVEHY